MATRQWIDLFGDPSQALNKLADTITRALRHPAPNLAVSDQKSGGGPAEGVTAQVPAMPSSTVTPAAPFSEKKKPSPKKRAPILAADSEEFEAVRALLARHIGPIAKVFVQKASGEAANLDAFCERLAGHVPSPADRATFLKAVKARLSAGR